MLWQHRFERAPDIPVFRLGDLREMTAPADGFERSESGVRLRFVRPDSPVVALLAFPGIPPVEFLNVRFFMKARDLKLGREFWDDGRLIIDWHPEAGGPVENDSVHSVRWEDPGADHEFVMRPKQGHAVPFLRLEHRGRDGEFELRRFEAIALRETAWWKIGKWILMAGWLAWAFAVVRGLGVRHRVRALLAATVWLVMGVYFVVPGPWKIQRPMISTAFEIGPEPASVRVPVSPQLPNKVDGIRPAGLELASVGRIPVKGDLALRIKLHLTKLRPFLHTLLLFFPAFVIAALVGWRPSLILCVVFALAIEGAQAAFGYGFDGIDAWDLVSDAFGIAGGLLAARWVFGWLESRRKRTVRP